MRRVPGRPPSAARVPRRRRRRAAPGASRRGPGAGRVRRPAVALAADDIEITTEARYTVDPDDAVVHVVVDITAVNRKPDLVTGTGVTRYFFDGVNLGVQPEAKRLRATQDGAPVDVSAARARDGFRLRDAGVPRANLYFGETAQRAPRRSTCRRGRRARTATSGWARRSRRSPPGRSATAGTVRVEVPAAFEVDIAGETDGARTGRAGSSRTWTATPPTPLSWYAWVNATNDDALTRDRLALADGDEVVIRGWPEDRRWRDLVRDLLEDGVPELWSSGSGSPWPVDGALEVTEVHTPLLEGYAGFYDPARRPDHDQRGPGRPDDRPRGVARLVQRRAVHRALDQRGPRRRVRVAGAGRPGPRQRRRRTRSGAATTAAFPLGDWPPPAAIRDEDAGEREQWGYDAAWHADAPDRRTGRGGRDARACSRRGRMRAPWPTRARARRSRAAAAQRLASVPGPGRGGRGGRRREAGPTTGRSPGCSTQ